jgi:hypothetical protein
VVHSLILGSPNQVLSFLALVFWSEPIDFPSKTGVPCRFSLNLPLFGLGPSSKGLVGWTNLKLSTNKIA